MKIKLTLLYNTKTITAATSRAGNVFYLEIAPMPDMLMFSLQLCYNQTN
jgi:hypothetical protein